LQNFGLVVFKAGGHKMQKMIEKFMIPVNILTVLHKPYKTCLQIQQNVNKNSQYALSLFGYSWRPSMTSWSLKTDPVLSFGNFSMSLQRTLSTNITFCRQTDRIGLCSVLHPCQHSIGYMGDGCYRSTDPTNI